MRMGSQDKATEMGSRGIPFKYLVNYLMMTFLSFHVIFTEVAATFLYVSLYSWRSG